MGTIVGLIVLFFGGGYLVRSVSQARSNSWTGPRTAGMRRRTTARGGAAGPRPVRHEIKLARVNAQLADWLKQRDHDRKNGSGTAPAPAVRRDPPLAKQALAGAVATVKRFGQPRPGTASGSSGSNGSAQPVPPAASSPPPAPARPAPASNGSTGRTAPMAASGTGGTEQLIEGINQVHVAAVSGGIHAKQKGVKASNEGCMRFSAMAEMLSRAMSEPGSNYGPEITEPLSKASQHLQAAAMAFGESDTALTTLMNMSVGELAASSRQAPHHGELSENGSH
jgi:hypothetical protein